MQAFIIFIPIGWVAVVFYSAIAIYVLSEMRFARKKPR
jgi:hypothetical protein